MSPSSNPNMSRVSTECSSSRRHLPTRCARIPWMKFAACRGSRYSPVRSKCVEKRVRENDGPWQQHRRGWYGWRSRTTLTQIHIIVSRRTGSTHLICSSNLCRRRAVTSVQTNGAVMGKQKSTRLVKRVIAPQRSGREEPIYGIEGDEALYEAIENERDTLSKAVSILRCLKISLEFDADDRVNRPYYPDIAEIACNLVRQAFNGLDSANLANAVMNHPPGKAQLATSDTP
jgi:hypothetical protein